MKPVSKFKHRMITTQDSETHIHTDATEHQQEDNLLSEKY